MRSLSVADSEGGGQYPVEQIMVTGARMDAGAPAPPPTPIAPGELSIGASVSMQFELAR